MPAFLIRSVSAANLHYFHLFLDLWVEWGGWSGFFLNHSVVLCSDLLVEFDPLQVLNCEDKAREVYMTALDHLPTSKVLWEVLVDFVEIEQLWSELVCLFALIR